MSVPCPSHSVFPPVLGSHPRQSLVGDRSLRGATLQWVCAGFFFSSRTKLARAGIEPGLPDPQENGLPIFQCVFLMYSLSTYKSRQDEMSMNRANLKQFLHAAESQDQGSCVGEVI